MESKELLSEVLGVEIMEVIQKDKSSKFVYYRTLSLVTHSINIHELAHKCKEWAFDRGYIIESGDRSTISIKAYLHDGNRNNTVAFGRISFGGISEVSAIFQACEWILKTVSTDTK